jgi:hypothetical protein
MWLQLLPFLCLGVVFGLYALYHGIRYCLSEAFPTSTRPTKHLDNNYKDTND